MKTRPALPAILVIALALGNSASPRAATGPRTSSQPGAHAQTAADPVHPPYQRQDTWYEFILRQFNPDEFDYGGWVERGRQAFIEGRLTNPCFLYGLCTTLVLLLMAMVCAKLRIDHRKAMWITAEMMADIYNQDAYSRRIAQEAIEKYNTHIERCNRAIEAEQGGTASAAGSEFEQLRGELICVAGERDTAARERDHAREELRRKSEIMAEMSLRLEALTNKSGAAGDGKRPAEFQGADARLLTHINNLQEQLYAERNNNRRLRGG